MRFPLPCGWWSETVPAIHSNIVGPSIASLNECFWLFDDSDIFNYVQIPLESFGALEILEVAELILSLFLIVWKIEQSRSQGPDRPDQLRIVKPWPMQEQAHRLHRGHSERYFSPKEDTWIILDHLVPSYTLLIIIVGYIAIIDHCWPSLTIKSINMWIFFMATMGSESCQAVGLTLPQFTEENWVRCAKAISNGLQRAVAKQHLVVKDGQSTW